MLKSHQEHPCTWRIFLSFLIILMLINLDFFEQILLLIPISTNGYVFLHQHSFLTISVWDPLWFSNWSNISHLILATSLWYTMFWSPMSANSILGNHISVALPVIPSYKTIVLLLLLLLLFLLLLLQNGCMQQFRNCCTILDLCLKYEIMDGFCSSRCPNNCID